MVSLGTHQTGALAEVLQTSQAHTAVRTPIGPLICFCVAML